MSEGEASFSVPSLEDSAGGGMAEVVSSACLMSVITRIAAMNLAVSSDSGLNTKFVVSCHLAVSNGSKLKTCGKFIVLRTCYVYHLAVSGGSGLKTCSKLIILHHY